MLLINAQQVKKYHAANLVLNGVTFQLQEGERAGLIGRNGSGKSTLFRLLAGCDHVDEGVLTRRKDLQTGYLPQVPKEFETMTVYEVLASGFNEIINLKHEMSVLEQQMSSTEAAEHPGIMEKLLLAYAQLQDSFELGGGYEIDTTIDQVTSGLQIERSYDERKFGSLSGGEKTRVVLASQLVMKPELLLLDEPTNHLDLKGIEWLEKFLERYDGTCMIVSHDRYFLDAVCNKIIELEDGEAHVYFSNYSGYMKEKEERVLQQFAQYEEQQKAVKKMKETIRKLEEWGRNGDNEKFFKRAASIRKVLEKMEIIKKPALEQKQASFMISPSDRSGRAVLQFEQLSKSFGNKQILHEAEGRLQYGEKVVLLGDNGTGKTTLFKLFLDEIQPDKGVLELGARVETGYLAQQEHTGTDHKLTLLKYFCIEGQYEEGEARNTLAQYLFYGNDVFKPISMLSGGEWSRIRLALLVRKKPNLLLLDEPTNHLDIASREALEEALEEFPGTLLAISHDRYFVNRLAKKVWELKNGKVRAFIGNYDDYKVYAARLDALGTKENVSVQQLERETEVERGSLQKNNLLTDSGRKQTLKQQKEKNSAGQLEQHIAALEAEAVLLDKQLAEWNASNEIEKLEKTWLEREQLQSKLDQLIEEWMEWMQ
ncbi:ribosomal protection-like ABC-F family protein [Paenibacillus sp. MBLB4367]|uniref:ribosomal protection-like ABC-F family protein n=1 Tax=Paenibacillus sp. MBLB4367 TaxID=3384767 RepID=UPI003908112E